VIDCKSHAGQGRSDREIMGRKQKTNLGKYSIVNGIVKLWNQLPADALGNLPCKPSNFRKKLGKLYIR
jgi:hypothetical protein